MRAMVDHDPTRILGRRKAGTLKLRETWEALTAEILPPDTSTARDVIENLRRGDVDGMSTGFRTVSDRWGHEGDVMVRELLLVDRLDVSVVAFPAYPATMAALRSFEAYRRCSKKRCPSKAVARRRTQFVST